MSGSAYPHEPGHRAVATSVEAAAAVKFPARVLRDQVLAEIERRPATSWEIAQALALPFETVQPRTSELQAMGLIRDSGARGPTRSPKRSAIKWEPVRHAA